MLKKIFIALLALVVLLGVGIFFLTANLDGIVRTAVEKYGSEAVQAPVRLESVKLDLRNGTGTLKGFSVANPSGFSKAKAISVGEISVALDTSSLAGKGPITIKKILIDKPSVVYEVLTNGDNNLAKISANAKAYAAEKTAAFKEGTKEAAKPVAKEPAKKKEAERRFVVKDLTISNGEAAITNPLLTKPLSAKIGTVHFTNIGADQGGATPAELTQILLGALNAQAIAASTKALAQEMIQVRGGEAAKKIQDKMKNLLGF